MQSSHKISSFSIIVLFVCLSLIGLGLSFYVPFQNTSTSELPAITVTFDMRKQFTPLIVENEVTNKLEQVLCRIEGLSDMSSSSNESSGSIEMKMLPGTDMKKARFLVTTSINNIWSQISDFTYYPNVKVSTVGSSANTSFMTYSVRANTSMSALSRFVEQKVKPALSRVKGIEEIHFDGSKYDNFIMTFNQATFDDLGVDLSSVTDVIRESNSVHALGLLPYIDENGKQVIMRFRLSSKADLMDLFNLQVKTNDGNKVPLSTLVNIIPDSNGEHSSIRINGQNTIFVDITAKADANQMLVSRRVRDAVRDLSAEMPDGYSIDLQNDGSEKLKSEIINIGVRLILTVVILLAFIFLSVRNIKIVLDIMLSLIISLTIAIIGYYLFNVEINMYALAAITISSNLMIDNIIVMSNHVLYRKNINAFMPMLAATLTTVGALAIVFFVGGIQKETLTDFSTVIIINLVASLFVATFFVPTLLDKTGFGMFRGKAFTKVRLRAIMLFNHFYENFIKFSTRYKIYFIVAIVLIFGLPTFLLPLKVDGEGMWSDIYNKTFGSMLYNEKIRPVVDKYIGGSLYRFNSYYAKNTEETDEFSVDLPVIVVSASLQPGASREMMDVPVRRMERYLATLPGIRQFRTSVSGASDATIEIYFSEDAYKNGVPFNIRNNIIKEALTVSGISWSVSGPGDMQFTNVPVGTYGEYSVVLKGYNYDQLNKYARQFRDSLENVVRVQNVAIMSRFTSWSNANTEYSFNISQRSLEKYGVSITDVVNELTRQYGEDNSLMISQDGTVKLLRPLSDEKAHYDMWALMNIPLMIKGSSVKLAELGTFKKYVAPMDILRHNQQYTLNVSFNYKGSYSKAISMLDKKIKNFNKILPMGYSVDYGKGNNATGDGAKTTALILVIIISIIFITTCVLLNSLKQPFAIIFVIPISFIGVFLSFSWLRIPLGDGVLAAMVLLCGLAVNANIYLTYEYNEIRKKNKCLLPVTAFVKAWNHKIGPVFLTIFSTVLGFLPFAIDNSADKFWYSLSVGIIAGLVSTVIGIFVFLPVFLIKMKK